MGRAGDDDSAVPLELAKDQQQRDGVGPAGQRDEHTAAVAQQRVTADGLEGPGGQRRHVKCQMPIAEC
jgi:hypothetical protein